MKKLFQIPVLFLACGALIFSGSDLMAQGNGKGKGNGNKKEYKHSDDDKYKDKKDKSAKAYKHNGKGKGRSFAHATPHNVKVPPGHYPAAGYYRIWYAGRPPGQQPPPVRYGQPNNAPITADAFILYGDKAYDTQYDWRQAETQQKKSVPREIIDVLFPSGVTTPAQ